MVNKIEFKLHKGTGYFEQYKKEESSKFNSIINEGSDLVVRRWLDNDFYVLNFNSTYTDKKLNLISGVSYSNYSGDHFGEVIWGSDLVPGAMIGDRYYFSDALKKDLNVFSKGTYKVNDKLSTYLDLQGRFINYQTYGLTSSRDPIDVDKSFNFFNPKTGFVYRIKDKNRPISLTLEKEPNRNDFKTVFRHLKSLTIMS